MSVYDMVNIILAGSQQGLERERQLQDMRRVAMLDQLDRQQLARANRIQDADRSIAAQDRAIAEKERRRGNRFENEDRAVAAQDRQRVQTVEALRAARGVFSRTFRETQDPRAAFKQVEPMLLNAGVDRQIIEAARAASSSPAEFNAFTASMASSIGSPPTVERITDANNRIVFAAVDDMGNPVNLQDSGVTVPEPATVQAARERGAAAQTRATERLQTYFDPATGRNILGRVNPETGELEPVADAPVGVAEQRQLRQLQSSINGVEASLGIYDTQIANLEQVIGFVRAGTAGGGNPTVAALLGRVPGTSEADFRALTDTAMLFNAFQSMQDMRRSGLTLGQITEREFERVMNGFSALSTNMTADTFLRNAEQLLTRLRDMREGTRREIENAAFILESRGMLRDFSQSEIVTQAPQPPAVSGGTGSSAWTIVE